MAGENIPILNVNSRPRCVPVVLPASEDLSLSGKVRNLLIRGVDNSGWLSFDPDTKRYNPIRKGYRLLEDLYEEEDNEAGWKLYLRYIKDWQDGKTQRAFPDHLLPKLVQDMQRGVVGAATKDPWNLPSPKPTTGAIANVPGNLAPEQPSRRSRGPRVVGPPPPSTLNSEEDPHCENPDDL